MTEPLRQLDLAASGINAVIWATGYGVDFGWIDLPVLDRRGEPRHVSGVTEVPGLYFLGLPWMVTVNSSFLTGVGDDAAALAAHIAARFLPVPVKIPVNVIHFTRDFTAAWSIWGLIRRGFPWRAITTVLTSNPSRRGATSGTPGSGAPIRRPVVIDGELFNALELGIAFADSDTAIAHAISHIDRFGRTYATAGTMIREVGTGFPRSCAHASHQCWKCPCCISSPRHLPRP